MISPNKQNLILLKQQNKLTCNGYKLLTEKRNGLILSFLNMAREGRAAEKKLLEKIKGYLERYRGASAFVSSEELLDELNLLTKNEGLRILLRKKRLSGVYVHEFTVSAVPPEREQLKPVLQHLLTNFAGLFQEVLRVSQLKINVAKLAQEIHKTNRQLSNLEQKIGQIESNIKYIKAALMEKENYEKSVLMKIFN